MEHRTIRLTGSSPVTTVMGCAKHRAACAVCASSLEPVSRPLLHRLPPKCLTMVFFIICKIFAKYYKIFVFSSRFYTLLAIEKLRRRLLPVHTALSPGTRVDVCAENSWRKLLIIQADNQTKTWWALHMDVWDFPGITKTFATTTAEFEEESSGCGWFYCSGHDIHGPRAASGFKSLVIQHCTTN